MRKRWNQKGTVHAKRRMSELRDRQLDLRKSAAITRWGIATGRDPREWWDAAQAEGITRAHTKLERIQWLEKRAAAPKGGPTESDPHRPYCKPDQSCCDFCCGN